MPVLMNDGTALNHESDEYLENIIALGGSAVSKSAMMPPYGQMLTQQEIQQLVAYTRAIAQLRYARFLNHLEATLNQSGSWARVKQYFFLPALLAQFC